MITIYTDGPVSDIKVVSNSQNNLNESLSKLENSPQFGLRARRRRRQLDDYEPRSTMFLRRHARRTGNTQLLEALDDPDFRRAANAAVIGLAEDDGVEVDEERPFRDWILGLLQALQPVLIKVITALLESWAGGGA